MKHSTPHGQLLQLLYSQNRVIGGVYASMAKELSSILRRYRNKGKKNVWFGNAKVKQEVDALLSRYQKIILASIAGNTSAAWNLSNAHNDGFVKGYTKGIAVPKKESKKYFRSNLAVLAAFQKRSRSGLNLSDRVWNLTNLTKGQLESYLAEGLTEGRSAIQMAGDLKRYLKEPDNRFRRVRNKEGKLIVSDPASKINPGRGVYRSSFKNALRLSRNETNIAYRTADVERRKQLPFVAGITVRLSAAHPQYDICDSLKGEYPKGFIFTGWHPNCLCFTTSKLLPKKDFIKYLNTGKLAGASEVRTIPRAADKFLTKNSERLNRLKSKPYFIQDNFKNTDRGLVLK